MGRPARRLRSDGREGLAGGPRPGGRGERPDARGGVAGVRGPGLGRLRSFGGSGAAARIGRDDRKARTLSGVPAVAGRLAGPAASHCDSARSRPGVELHVARTVATFAAAGSRAIAHGGLRRPALPRPGRVGGADVAVRPGGRRGRLRAGGRSTSRPGQRPLGAGTGGPPDLPGRGDVRRPGRPGLARRSARRPAAADDAAAACWSAHPITARPTPGSPWPRSSPRRRGFAFASCSDPEWATTGSKTSTTGGWIESKGPDQYMALMLKLK